MMSAVDALSEFQACPASALQSEPWMWAGYDIEILTSPILLEPHWRKLETSGIASAFQSFDYVSDWLNEASSASGETPLFVVGRRAHEVHFILPLALRRSVGVSVLTWLAQSHANYGMGLYSRAFLKDARDAPSDDLIRGIAKSTGAHLVHLQAQPARWMGFDNPFAISMANQLTGNDTHIVHLDDDFAAQYKRLFSSASLSKMRRKWRRISEFGSAEFTQPKTHGDRSAALHWFIETKGAQLAETGRGNPFGTAHIRAFYSALSLHRAFVADALILNGQPEAVGLTLKNGRSAYYLNTAFTRSEISKYSPGFHLFHQLVLRLHQEGIRLLDLGPGDVPYKHDWQPQVINLRTATHLVSLLALPHYLTMRAGVAIKCALKRNPALLDLVRRLVAWRGHAA